MIPQGFLLANSSFSIVFHVSCQQCCMSGLLQSRQDSVNLTFILSLFSLLTVY